MRNNRNTLILIASSILSLTAWCATNAFGGLSLTKIPTLGTDTSNQGRCITPDGKYIGDLPGTANGFFYDVANNSVIQPEPGIDPRQSQEESSRAPEAAGSAGIPAV